MPIYTSRSLWTSPPALDPATSAWVAAVVANGGSVSTPRQTVVNTLITGLKTDSVWTKLDRLWLHAGENQPYALTDLVALDLASAVSSPSFTADQGYTGDGAASYINTTYKPSTDAINWSQNSASMGFWAASGSGGTGTTCPIGARISSVYADTRYFTNAMAVLGFNDAGAGGFNGPVTAFPGFWITTRTGASAEALYKDGVSNATGTDTSTGTIADNIFVLARNADGSADSFFGSAPIAASFTGGGLSGTDASNLYTRLRTYMTAVGVP